MATSFVFVTKRRAASYLSTFVSAKRLWNMIQYNRATMCKGGIVPLSKEKPQACAVLLSSLLLLPKHYKLTFPDAWKIFLT
jgi:hypothetical protein